MISGARNIAAEVSANDGARNLVSPSMTEQTVASASRNESQLRTCRAGGRAVRGQRATATPAGRSGAHGAAGPSVAGPGRCSRRRHWVHRLMRDQPWAHMPGSCSVRQSASRSSSSASLIPGRSPPPGWSATSSLSQWWYSLRSPSPPAPNLHHRRRSANVGSAHRTESDPDRETDSFGPVKPGRVPVGNGRSGSRWTSPGRWSTPHRRAWAPTASPSPCPARRPIGRRS